MRVGGPIVAALAQLHAYREPHGALSTDSVFIGGKDNCLLTSFSMCHSVVRMVVMYIYH